MVQAWERQQDALVGEKMSEKEVENLNMDKRKKDLEKLKKKGGPFTTSTDVKSYVENTSIDDSEKTSRLYTRG